MLGGKGGGRRDYKRLLMLPFRWRQTLMKDARRGLHS